MSGGQHPARLSAGDHAFRGSEIDRARPLRFRLNGRTIAGFGGDSVLSAVLAAGITAVGTFSGAPLALGERFCPAIQPEGTKNSALALPIDRTPAIDGAEWWTCGLGQPPRGLAAHLGDKSSLGLRLDGQRRVQRPWLDAPPANETACDLVIVGGGVAGMSAAVSAGKLGMHVALLERNAQLGGTGAMFGTLDGEEPPAQAVARLNGEIASLSNISVFHRAEVYSVRPGRVEFHVVELDGTVPRGRMFTLAAKSIILATGTQERLPVFPGNRLPGVVTAVQAYEQARRFAYWPGTTAVLATVASASYRLATQAHDAGVVFSRLVDVRPNPQSRFIEFAKAYGLTQVSGTRVETVTRTKQGLEIDLVLDHARLQAEGIRLLADRLIVCGGFQPDLSLWLGGGGTANWAPERNRLEAGGGPEGVVLAGSAAGWLSRNACQQSGVDAVDALFQRKRKLVTELQIDPIYETPDAPAPVHGARGAAPAYLDFSDSLIAAPAVGTRPGIFKRKTAPWRLADTTQAFGLNDIAAGVQLGAIAPEQAGVVALERTSMNLSLAPASTLPATRKDAGINLIPPYLSGRFGSDAQIWEIKANSLRQLETGLLIFANSDETDPMQAIGVVVGADRTATLALIESGYAIAGHGVTVRDRAQAIGAKVIAPYDLTSDTPFGGNPSTP